MEMDQEQQPIIKKKKKGGHGHHGGAWKVAYADFVTAMMALFIVLWVLGQNDEVKENVAGYFKDPANFIPIKSGGGILDGGSLNPIEQKKIEEIKRKEEEKEKLNDVGEELLTQLKMDADLSEIMHQVEIQFTDEGMRIELIESLKDAFFEIGTAKLNAKAQALLRKMGENFSRVNNQIIIEGHTDARPYQNNGLGYTNFELSTDRANSARRALIEGGVKDNQILEIRGYADKKLKNPANPFDIFNRRVTIILKYTGSYEN